MPQSDAVDTIEALAPGKRVRVVTAQGLFDLPRPKIGPPADPPNIDEHATAVLSSVRDSVTQMADSVSVAVAGINSAAERMDSKDSQAQDEIREGLRQIVSTLEQPVRPVYDKAGKLIGARREVEKGGSK